MSDCMNVEVRELLPELLHDALPAAARARVEAHVAACAECASELAILRTARAVARARPVPSIDTRAIVAALPRPVAMTPARGRGQRLLWRVAATVTIVALGGTSLSIIRRSGIVPAAGDTMAVAPLPGVAVTPAAAPVNSPAADAHPVALTAGGGVADLADEDLEALIGALDRLEAAPHADPDSSGLTRIVSGSTGGN